VINVIAFAIILVCTAGLTLLFELLQAGQTGSPQTFGTDRFMQLALIMQKANFCLNQSK
jgi:hypothetical protein